MCGVGRGRVGEKEMVRSFQRVQFISEDEGFEGHCAMNAGISLPVGLEPRHLVIPSLDPKSGVLTTGQHGRFRIYEQIM